MFGQFQPSGSGRLPTNMSASTNHYRQVIAYTLLLILVLAYAFSYRYSLVVLDTARDLFRATEIRDLQHFPLQGPDIGGMFHTGPIWFYFLAIPALTGSLVWLSFWVGLFAGLKFVLAYLLGQSLVSGRFGLLWAFMLLLPGWHSINQMIISHTNLQETLSLLLLLMLHRLHVTKQPKYWYLAALTMGLGFHAHPTFLALGVFYIPILWQQKSHLSWRMLFGALGLFLLPLLPYLYEQITLGFADLTRITQQSILADQITASGSALDQRSWVLHVWQNVGSVVYSAPERMIEFVSVHLGQIGTVMAVIVSVLMGLSVAGMVWLLVKRPAGRKLFLLGLFGWLLTMMLVAGMRSFTPYYMILSLTPVWLGLVALGCYVWVRNNPAGQALMMTCLLLIGCLPTMAVHRAASEKQVNLGPLMNITETPQKDWYQQPTLDAMTVQDSDALAAWLCTQSTVVNGPLAAVLDLTSGATLDFFCGDYSVTLGGAPAHQSRSVLLLPKVFWVGMQASPEQWITPSWGYTSRFQNHGPAQGLDFAPFKNAVHPPRKDSQPAAKKTHSIQLSTTTEEYLLVTNVLPAYRSFKLSNVTANGDPVDLLMGNAANRLYFCASCQGEPIQWSFELTTNDLAAIDINTLKQ